MAWSLFRSRKGKEALKRQQAYRVINEAARAVGINEKIGTHTLRKTFGYHAYQSGVDLSVLQNAPTESTELIKLTNLFEKNICKLNNKNKKDLINWLDRLPYELIESEILYAAENSARSLNKVLTDNIKRDLTDLLAVEESRRIHTDKNKRTTVKRNKKPTRTEPKPDWFSKREESILVAPAIDPSENDDDFEERKAKKEAESGVWENHQRYFKFIL